MSRAEMAVADGAPLLHEEAGTNVLIAREFKKGDVAADLNAAAVRVGGRFEMTRKAPLAMEPRSYTAEYEKRRDAITLYTSSNIPGIVRDAISESLDLPGHRLRVVAPDVGGSFGSKGSLYPEELLICIAARKLAPVGQMDGGPSGGRQQQQPGFRRDRRCGNGIRRRTASQHRCKRT